MIIFIVAVVLLFLLGKSGKFPFAINNPNLNATPVTSGPGTTTVIQSAVPQTPVIKNSTGASLSNALGASSAPPGYYSSGTPGYLSGAGVTPINAGPSASRTSDIIRSGVRTGVAVPIAPKVPVVRGTVNIPRPSPVNPAGTYSPALANRPVTVSRTSPEVSSPFWARMPLRY